MFVSTLIPHISAAHLCRSMDRGLCDRIYATYGCKHHAYAPAEFSVLVPGLRLVRPCLVQNVIKSFLCHAS